MIVDTSALVAILKEGPSSKDLLRALPASWGLNGYPPQIISKPGS